MSRMDQKLARIRDGRYTKADFMIADAKDGDMGSGVCGLGPKSANGSNAGFRSRQDYQAQIREIVAQDIVDIMLVSASNLEVLQAQGAFRQSEVQPAIRANEATDVFGGIRHGRYTMHPSRPFRSASISRLMQSRPHAGTDLGLYSMTFNNDIDADMATLEAFNDFREEAAAYGFRYFLEVFNPNAPLNLGKEQVPQFVNDHIVRCVAGVMQADRPLFLKIPFNGPAAMEELASYDSSIVIGVLGGGAGTARDTFELLRQAEKHGARLALFGRKINLAESALEMVAMMRRVVDGAITPAEAVRAYHDALQKQGLRPQRSLDNDLEITEEPLRQAA